MGITLGQRVNHRKDPVTVGTVVQRGERRVAVEWDGTGVSQHLLDEIVPAHGRRMENSSIEAPGIEDLEFETRLDPTTGSLHVLRDASYRGDDAEFPEVSSSQQAYAMLSGMGVLPQENIAVMLLDEHDRVLGLNRKHQGHLDSVEASLRQILTDALLSGRAAGIIFAHNHPSGDPGPSPDDENLTRAVERLAAKLGIRLVDHIVVGRPGEGRGEYFSFRDAGGMTDPPLAAEVADPPPPPPIRTEGMSDLEFVIDRDEESGSLMPVRDGDYRGDAARKPVIEGVDDLIKLFPEVGDGATVAVLLDTRQQMVGWTAWGDAQGETSERLIRRAVVPPLMMNARSVAFLRATGAPPTRHDDDLVSALALIYAELDIEIFDVLVGGDEAWISYNDEGRLGE